MRSKEFAHGFDLSGSGARNKHGKYRSKDRQPKAKSTPAPMGARRGRAGITGCPRTATRLPELFLQRARDVLEDLFFPPSIIALRTGRTNPVVDGHVAAVELNDARFDDDIVTAINQSRSCIWLAHRALSRSPRLPLSLPSKRTRYGHGTSHRVSGQERIQLGRQWCSRCVGCWSAKEVV